MLEYINTGVANDESTQILEAAVTEARLKEEWRLEYMRTITYRDEIYADGFSDGKIQERIQMLHDYLSNGGSESDAIKIFRATKEELIAAQS